LRLVQQLVVVKNDSLEYWKSIGQAEGIQLDAEIIRLLISL
jgi:hypothetical protein